MQSNSSDCFYSQLGTTLGSNNFPFAIHVVSLNIVLHINNHLLFSRGRLFDDENL
jgi:hypothetical protein